MITVRVTAAVTASIGGVSCAAWGRRPQQREADLALHRLPRLFGGAELDGHGTTGARDPVKEIREAKPGSVSVILVRTPGSRPALGSKCFRWSSAFRRRRTGSPNQPRRLKAELQRLDFPTPSFNLTHDRQALPSTPQERP
jgi:hypothetical protein